MLRVEKQSPRELNMKNPGARSWQYPTKSSPRQACLYLSWHMGNNLLQWQPLAHYHMAPPGITEQRGSQTKLRRSNNLICFYRPT